MKLSSNALIQLALLTLTTMAGLVIYLLVLRLGTHLVVRDAHLWGLTGGIFLYLCQFLFASRKMRRARGVSYNMRLGIILVALTSLAGALWSGVSQVQRGYPSLPRDETSNGGNIGKHFTMETDVNPKRAYHMTGDLGGFKLVPALSYDSHVLIMLPDFPTTKRIKVTGKLRADIRTVQRSKDGKVEGPFLQIYREDMNLSPSTKITFLDTSNRAGLNFTVVIWFLVSLYLFLYGMRLIPVPVQRSTIKF